MKKVKKTYEPLTIVPLMQESGHFVIMASIVDHDAIRTMGQELADPVSFDQTAPDGGQTFNHDWEGGSL